MSTMTHVDGSKIRADRERAGIAQVTLATAAGISRQHLCNIEAGRAPRVRTLVVKAMADTLGVELHDLTAAPIAA